jgi:hypothetical protein
MRGPTILQGMPHNPIPTGPVEPLIASEVPPLEGQMYAEDQISTVLGKLAPQLSSPNNIIFNRVLVCPVNAEEISSEGMFDEIAGMSSSKTDYNNVIEHLSFPKTVSTVALIDGHYILCTATYRDTGIENLTITDSSRSAEPDASGYPALFSEHSPFYGLAPDKVTFSPQLYQRQGSTDCGPLSICNLLIKNGIVQGTEFSNSYIDTVFLRDGYDIAAILDDGEQIKDALGEIISGMSDHSHPFLDHKYDQVAFYCAAMGMPHPDRVLSEIILPRNPEIDPLVLATGLQEYFHWAESPSGYGVTSSVSDNPAGLFSSSSATLAHAHEQTRALEGLRELDSQALGEAWGQGVTTGDPLLDSQIMRRVSTETETAPENSSRTLLERIIDAFKSVLIRLGFLSSEVATHDIASTASSHTISGESGLGQTETATDPLREKKEEIITTLTALGIDDLSPNELELLSVINEHSDNLVAELSNIREITASNPDIKQNKLATRLLDMRPSGHTPR